MGGSASMEFIDRPVCMVLSRCIRRLIVLVLEFPIFNHENEDDEEDDFERDFAALSLPAVLKGS
jgi:hypothetical protein